MDTRTRLSLRLDESLHEVLTAKAKRERRSLNSEINCRLQRSLERLEHQEPIQVWPPIT
jgi:predicted HicB family RNase H-like nuclease